MNRPSKEELESIVRLKNDHDFLIIVNWLNESKKTIQSNIFATIEPETTRLQGEGRTLEYILDKIQDAKLILEPKKRPA